jgi:hypothetical protein
MNHLTLTDINSESSSSNDSSDDSSNESSNDNSLNKIDYVNQLIDRNINDFNKNKNEYDIFNHKFKIINILINTYVINKSPTFNTSNYVYHFNLTEYNNNNLENVSENLSGGYDKYTEVIGFRLNKAIIQNVAYTINNNNNLFVYQIEDDNTIYKLELINGYYHNKNLCDSIPNNSHNINFEWKNIIWKYCIKSSNKIKILWNYNEKTKCLAYNMGYYVNYNNNYDNIVNAENVADLNINYVDLVIEEIPQISCKQNSYGKHIIDRIPLDIDFGKIKYYEPDYYINDEYTRYFYPITLDKLTIKLYSPCNILFDNQQSNHSFEFELILKNI